MILYNMGFAMCSLYLHIAYIFVINLLNPMLVRGGEFNYQWSQYVFSSLVRFFRDLLLFSVLTCIGFYSVCVLSYKALLLSGYAMVANNFLTHVHVWIYYVTTCLDTFKFPRWISVDVFQS